MELGGSPAASHPVIQLPRVSVATEKEGSEGCRQSLRGTQSRAEAGWKAKGEAMTGTNGTTGSKNQMETEINSKGGPRRQTLACSSYPGTQAHP